MCIYCVDESNRFVFQSCSKTKVSPISVCFRKKKSKEINSKYKLLQIYHKRAFRYCIPYLYDILSSFTSCYKRDSNIIITFNTEYFQLYQLVKHLKELLIEDILRHFPTLCNRSDAEHNLLLFNVSLDRRKF